MSFDYSSDEFEKQYTYTGNDLGAVWTKAQTTFRVWAPTASAVSVDLYDAGSGGQPRTVSMVSAEKGTWLLTLPGDLNGVYYTYTAIVDGIRREACDPYAKACGVNGHRAMVIDLSTTNPTGWTKDSDPNAGKAVTDAVIYELHIRDLSIDPSSGIRHKGKFLGLTETGTVNPHGQSTGLDHIKSLGITHLHLLPSYDFGSVDEASNAPQFNWGYDPVNYNIPEGSYATDPYDGHVRVREFKQMVETLHQNGISVVMDVVYNHVFDADTFCFNRLVPGYFSRGSSNGSGCGNDTASERSMVRKYIVDSVCYWADEYHIDGFRFDLVGLLDVGTVNAIVSTVHAKHPHVLFYGEGWDIPSLMTKPNVKMAIKPNSHLTPQFAYFSDTLRDLLRGSVWEDTQLGFVSGQTGLKPLLEQCIQGMPDWCGDPTQSVNYASCHDNMTLFDRIVISTPTASRAQQIRMNNLTAAIYMLCQGIPFIHAGEELLRTKNFDHNSYRSPDSVNSIKWNDLNKEEYRQTLAYYQGLIRLRSTYSVLRLTDVQEVRNTVLPRHDTPEHTAAFHLKGKQELYIIFNALQDHQTFPLPQGRWKVLVQDQQVGTVPFSIQTDSVAVSPISATVLEKCEQI